MDVDKEFVKEIDVTSHIIVYLMYKKYNRMPYENVTSWWEPVQK